MWRIAGGIILAVAILAAWRMFRQIIDEWHIKEPRPYDESEVKHSVSRRLDQLAADEEHTDR